MFLGYFEVRQEKIMGGSQSQSYDLSHESMKSLQDKQDIVPSNNVVDGTLIHITSSESSNVLPNAQVIRHFYSSNNKYKIYKKRIRQMLSKWMGRVLYGAKKSFYDFSEQIGPVVLR